jgi:hypothetical protein
MNISDELIRIIYENNAMLHKIIQYIDKVDSEEYKNTEDIKSLVTNLVANMYINNKNIK